MSETGARAADDAGLGKHVVEPEPEPTSQTSAEVDAPAEPGVEPDWWHRSHPTFAGVAGFFTGIAFVIAVPGVYATLLNAFLGEKTAQRLFPYVLIALLVPLGLLVPRKTRRFAQLMLVGMVATVIVVAVTAGMVLWFLISRDN
ncbi:hypothetical protein [Nocardioides cynanchi]|uniref:hypothetical protein n=1 Tax=Nocardioides cynanchi TaxID=2558918 RepID=UPI001EE399B0|nr:hypothetical protein [Nocardioides cynanchi]